ncbi:MAG: sigma-E processing peptidase SpoIIGA [Bacillaceae bacterium G1]|nr:MAG: sigma-E processing peptidase SpoIIGA [Bacillaceae bacterium G1]
MVYIDLLFAQNVLIDYLLLSLTSIWRTEPVKKWRMWAAAVLGGTYVLFFFYLRFGFLYTFLAKICFSCILVLLAFGFAGWRPFFRLLATFYMTAFVMGGCVMALYWLLQSQVDVLYAFRFLRSADMMQCSVLGVLAVGYPFSWWFSRWTYRSLQRQKLVFDQLLQVAGTVLGHRFQCTGLVDTGNQLYDPISRMPVMLVEVAAMPFLPAPLVRMVDAASEGRLDEMLDTLDDAWASQLRIIPYRTVGRADAWLVALRPDGLSLQMGERRYDVRRVLIGLTSVSLSPDGTYQAIVHPSLLQYQAS